ncbi:hypothetical protein ACFXOL_14425 [Streptomyces californicus]|uniref:hypothetical protein n=1 Tax=Streptomyces TaxID=1883 RepID=UPI00211AAACC|nr:hypothetical protein [Streptomyces sp. CB04723]
MEQHVLEALLGADGGEAAGKALAVLRGGGGYWVGDRAQPAGRHAGVYGQRLRRMRKYGVEPLGLEAAVQAVRAYGRPVRTGMVDAADRSWTALLFLTEDGGTLLACAGWPLPLVRTPPVGKPSVGEPPAGQPPAGQPDGGRADTGAPDVGGPLS